MAVNILIHPENTFSYILMNKIREIEGVSILKLPRETIVKTEIAFKYQMIFLTNSVILLIFQLFYLYS